MNLRYFKNIIPAAAVLFAAAGLSSCTGDLDVTPIDPSKTMVPDEAALFTKCYSNMALQGQGGPMRLSAHGETPVFPHLTITSMMPHIPCSRDSTIVFIQVLHSATIISKYVQAWMPHVRLKFASFVPSTIII